MERYNKYFISLITIIFSILVAKGEKTLNIFIPSMFNSEIRIVVNGHDKGILKLPTKSKKSFNDWKTDLISYKESVVPVVIAAEGPVNILVEMKYLNPTNGEESKFSDERTFTIDDGDDLFCEVKSTGVFGGLKIKEQDRKKGVKKLNSGKYSMLSCINVSKSEKYEPNEILVAKRKEDKKIEDDNRKSLRKKMFSQMAEGVGQVATELSGIGSETVKSSNSKGEDSELSEDGEEINASSNGKRLKQSERRELKKAYDDKIESIKHYYHAISFVSESQKLEAKDPDSQSRDEIKILANKNKDYLN